MTRYRNPFPADPDRSQIWQMLVERDIRAFVACDWSLVADDFLPEAFSAVDARGRSNPDSWRFGPTLAEYRTSWLRSAAALREQVADPETGLCEATVLRDIDIDGDRALAHKKFDGQIPRRDGSLLHLRRQTLYKCQRVDGRWRIVGFIGYLPNPMGDAEQPAPGKVLPKAAAQHATAGPYSPVLSVRADRLVVISGQAAVTADGTITADTIEEQARATLEHCARQLRHAGSALQDVFKVNVFLADMSLWEPFNTVYRDVMPTPLPVRTAVGAALLDGLLVEVEMWAVGK